MAIATKLLAIGILSLSFAVGFISFYFLSDLPKERKRKHIGELFSQLINFVIFIWIGKVIVNVPIFLDDPLAVLAYPSNSDAFYIAILGTASILLYKKIREKIDMLPLFGSFLHIFLVASFLYEFIQFITGANRYAFGYLVLLSILLILYIYFYGRTTTNRLLGMLFIGWSAGILVLLFIQPFVSIFGYTMTPWFIVLFFIICFSIIIYKERRSRHERN